MRRRSLLQGMGVVAACCATGCRIALDQGGPSDLIDASTQPPDAAQTNYMMCGTNQLCLDLSLPANVALTTVGGALKLKVNNLTLICVRASTTAVDTLSDICTHAGCALNYSSSVMQLVCPCHGSRFSLTGSVVKGPAIKPITSYATTFDQAKNLVTITL